MSQSAHFQYSVLKYTADIQTDEYLNIGLAMYSKSARFFKVQILARYGRIAKTFINVDGEFFRHYIHHLQNQFDQLTYEIEGPQLHFWHNPPDDITGILSKVIVPDDSGLRFAAPKDGFADEHDNVFAHFYNRLIERHLEAIVQPERDDNDVWNVFKKPLYQKNVLNRLGPLTITTKYEPLEFGHAWKNGHWNVLQPLSFDLVYAANISRKAKTWLGTLTVLKTAKETPSLFFLVGKPRTKQRTDLYRAYDNALRMLADQSGDVPVRIVEEDRAERFAEKIQPEIDASGTRPEFA